MWRKGKKRGKDEGEEQSSAADPDGAPPSKRPAAKRDDDDDDGDDIVVCEISKNRRVTVRNWQGRIVVDIREFYVKDGKQLPGKKGISLPMDQWKILLEHIDEIDKAVTENA